MSVLTTPGRRSGAPAWGMPGWFAPTVGARNALCLSLCTAPVTGPKGTHHHYHTRRWTTDLQLLIFLIPLPGRLLKVPIFRLSSSKSRRVVNGVENNGVLTGWRGYDSGHEAETREWFKRVHIPTRSKGHMRCILACRSGHDAKAVCGGTTIRALGLDTSGSIVAICA